MAQSPPRGATQSTADPQRFRSPLLRRRRDPLNQLRFGLPANDPRRELLRERLDASLRATVAALPHALREPAAALLAGYGAGKVPFIGLFYSPTWSFLRERALPDEAQALAEQVQAHALFLHLWDDHLCDGQLAPDFVRLQLRTVAWQRFESGARALLRARGRDAAPADDAPVDRAIERYFRSGPVAGRGRPAVGDLGAYLDRFRDEVAIWTLVPALIEGNTESHPAGPLAAAVEHFSLAWRLLDDIQDTYEDVLTGNHSAVWWACSEAQRSIWDSCHAARAEPRAFTELLAAFTESGLVSSLLLRTCEHLDLAREAAVAAGCPDLAADLASMRSGLVNSTTAESLP
jgi:hypothetical protein